MSVKDHIKTMPTRLQEESAGRGTVTLPNTDYEKQIVNQSS